jgi:hypothetical protein
MMKTPDQQRSHRIRLYLSAAAIIVGGLGLWVTRAGASSEVFMIFAGGFFALVFTILVLDFRQLRVHHPKVFFFRFLEFSSWLCLLCSLGVASFAIVAQVWRIE